MEKLVQPKNSQILSYICITVVVMNNIKCENVPRIHMSCLKNIWETPET